MNEWKISQYMIQYLFVANFCFFFMSHPHIQINIKKRRIRSDRKFVLRCVGKYQMTKAIFHVKCHGRWTIWSKKKGQITTKLIHNLQWIFLFSLWLVISRITTTLNAKGRLWPKNLFIFFLLLRHLESFIQLKNSFFSDKLLSLCPFSHSI
jgi:hypothetical protein